METAASAPPSASSSDPQDSSATTLPNNIAVVLHAVRTLLGYGRHLIDTVRHRAAAPTFNPIAAAFGTGNLSTIVVLRAAALKRVLLARAATGRDIDFAERRGETPPVRLAATEPPAERKQAPRPSRPRGLNDPELFMPTLQDLERQVRRRPIGRTIVDICLDLAVVPGFCTGDFWNELFVIMHCFGGSVATLMQQKTRREHAFAQEQDRKPHSNWDWVRMKRDALRQVLGFFIGRRSTSSQPTRWLPPGRRDCFLCHGGVSHGQRRPTRTSFSSS